MCSLPTIKFSAPPGLGWPGLACGLGGVGTVALSRGGPLSFSLCTYSVRMIKNCPVEAVISLMTFRAADGDALKLTSTTLRWINVGAGLLPGFAVTRAPAAFRARAGAGVGVDFSEALCSWAKGAR